MIELFIGLLAFFVTWMTVPFLRNLAIRFHFVDMPNHRKVHKDPLPMLGGAAIFFGLIVSLLVVKWLGYPLDKVNVGIVAGAIMVFAIGLIDDYFKTRSKDFPAFPRFIIQIAAAYLVVHFGGAVRGIGIPYPEYHYIIFPHSISVVLTVIWIVGVINVFNFLDGIDGLAAGIAAISSITLVSVALVQGQMNAAFCAIALTGSSLGFLKHNFFPARIIMGDSGSGLIGFLLASIAIIGTMKKITILSIFVPILALGVPILDGIRVVIQRMMKGKAPYAADRTHGHHKLLDAGFTQKQAVFILYLIGTCFSLTSVIILLLNG
ncbi:MraY family glycosyltransferase [Falsibacillus albus]|uniref:Undecaprenyl/decaprenyl-phosphate alpha-N-acetylglucosaminyl 1-phosphate transferase n=1 Tax=Falsibacillus albus TaxID=2478915 RepID=A0A3L7JUY2_9BACI|nr:MraY family glycosyltransferase [Falsibacillus albus]RLQ94593.1 undecaprenyl/decaprenyl-phosphate alpha-N-acetylglucosaminyl 1-phosphate transferase [Falsibacillus albus]